MSELLAWNRLDDAAALLRKATGEEWTARRVLDAALQFPAEQGDNPPGASNRRTLISAALPEGHKLVRYLLNVGKGRERFAEMLRIAPEARKAQAVPLFEMPWRPVTLLQTEVGQLLAAGWVQLKAAGVDNYGEGTEIVAVEPPATVRMDDVGLRKLDFAELARHISNRAVAERLREQVHNGGPVDWARLARLPKLTPMQAARAAHCIDPIRWPDPDEYAQGLLASSPIRDTRAHVQRSIPTLPETSRQLRERIDSLAQELGGREAPLSALVAYLRDKAPARMREAVETPAKPATEPAPQLDESAGEGQSKYAAIYNDQARDWRDRARAMASQWWLDCPDDTKPNRSMAAEFLVRWCRSNSVRGAGGWPDKNYLRNHVLDVNHWMPPNRRRG